MMAVSADAVKWAYRLVLGREPENEDVIRLWQHERTTQSLLYSFIQSRECRDRALVQGLDAFIYEPSTEVEIDCTPSELSVMLQRIQAAWSAFGETDAHWSVITDPNFSKDRIDEYLESFYLTGRDNANRVTKALLRNGIDFAGIRNVVDFGCGVGRISFALAESFTDVLGLDISEGHLRLANERRLATSSKNTTFQQIRSIDDIDSIGKHDLMVSFIVLQHNPPPVSATILRKLLNRLRPGGVAMFQIPTYLHGYKFLAKEYLENIQPQMEMNAIPQKHLFTIIDECGCRALEVREDLSIADIPAISQTFLVQKRI